MVPGCYCVVLAACPLAIGIQRLSRWAVVPWYRVEALSDGSSHCRQVSAGPRQYLMTLVPHQLACLHPGHCQLDHQPTWHLDRYADDYQLTPRPTLFSLCPLLLADPLVPKAADQLPALPSRHQSRRLLGLAFHNLGRSNARLSLALTRLDTARRLDFHFSFRAASQF